MVIMPNTVLELSSIEKLLTGVNGCCWSPFSKIIFMKIFGWIRKVLSQLDQRNLVFSNQINGNRSRAYLNTRKTTFWHETVKNAQYASFGTPQSHIRHYMATG